MTASIDIRDLSFRYQVEDQEDVFSGVTLFLNPGEIFSLIGPNGTGKSTLIRCIGGLLSAQTGEVFIEGVKISGMKSSHTARVIGYVPQNHPPSFPFPVREVVVMGRAPHLGIFSSPTAHDMDIAEKAMESVGIYHLADRPSTAISGGEWQLVLIARALTQQPRILLLDEPTSHLDLGNQMRILNTILNLSRQGLTIVMATHFPDHAFLVSGRVGIMKDHELILTGTPEKVITEETMRSAYGVEVRVFTLNGDPWRRVCVPMISAS